jgi:hypothetical protein
MTQEKEKISAEPVCCPWCGHARCGKCAEDRWPRLADGCCSCAAWVLRRAKLGEVS